MSLWILFYKKYLFLLTNKCIVKNESIVIVKIVLKEVKQEQINKDIFVIVISCGKTFILKSNGRNYDEELKKKQSDYSLKVIAFIAVGKN